MFDIGWLELIIIGIVALIVVGPDDLPGMFRSAGRFMGKMRGMAREFQRAMEDAADQSGLKDATDSLNKIHNVTRPGAAAKNFAKDFTKKAGLDDLKDLQSDLDSASKELPKVKPASATVKPADADAPPPVTQGDSPAAAEAPAKPAPQTTES